MKYWFRLILFGLLVFSFPAKAQEMIPKIGISPHTFDMQVLPGQVVNSKVKIINQGEMPFPMRVSVRNFTAQEVTGQMVLDEQALDPSFTPALWFETEKNDFILEPGEIEQIVFKITVPDNAEPGGHYALMVFEPQLPSFYFKEGALVKNIPEIGVLFLMSVKKFTLEQDVTDKIDVVEFSLPEEERITGLEKFFTKTVANVAIAADINISEGRPSKFLLFLKNNDIYHIKPFGEVSIYNMFGNKVAEADIPQLTILPDKTRMFTIEAQTEIPQSLKWLPDFISELLIKNFFIGKYTAKIELEANSPLQAQAFAIDSPEFLVFFSFPWKFWLLSLMIISFLVSVIFKFKDRFKKALKILSSRQGN